MFSIKLKGPDIIRMDETEVDDGADLFNLFFNSDYVEQTVPLPSGRSMSFLGLKAAFTDSDLTGQILWPGCTLLLRWIDRNLDVFAGKSVIEVGAGTAVCALMVARHGTPTRVMATDGSEPVTELMAKNAKLHEVDNIFTCKRMRWIPEDWEPIIGSHGRYNFVIGSEIAYDEGCIDGLVEAVDALLAPGGRFVIGHIDRYARVTRALLAKMDEVGFEKECEVPWGELVEYEMELIVGSVIVWKRKETTKVE